MAAASEKENTVAFYLIPILGIFLLVAVVLLVVCLFKRFNQWLFNWQLFFFAEREWWRGWTNPAVRAAQAGTRTASRISRLVSSSKYLCFLDCMNYLFWGFEPQQLFVCLSAGGKIRQSAGLEHLKPKLTGVLFRYLANLTMGHFGKRIVVNDLAWPICLFRPNKTLLHIEINGLK